MNRITFELADLLKRLRSNTKLSQSKAGERARSSRRAIANLENAKREITLQELITLLQAYDVPVFYGLAYAMLLANSTGQPLRPEDRKILNTVVADLSSRGYMLPMSPDHH